MIIVARRKENHFAALTPKRAGAQGASGRQPLNADDGADGPLPAIPGLRDIRASCASAGPRAEKEALLPSVASPVVNPGAIAASLGRLLHVRDHLSPAAMPSSTALSLTRKVMVIAGQPSAAMGS